MDVVTQSKHSKHKIFCGLLLLAGHKRKKSDRSNEKCGTLLVVCGFLAEPCLLLTQLASSRVSSRFKCHFELFGNSAAISARLWHVIASVPFRALNCQCLVIARVPLRASNRQCDGTTVLLRVPWPFRASNRQCVFGMFQVSIPNRCYLSWPQLGYRAGSARLGPRRRVCLDQWFRGWFRAVVPWLIRATDDSRTCVVTGPVTTHDFTPFFQSHKDWRFIQ